MSPQNAVRGPRERHHHLWPHGVRVLDLGDDVHVAAHLRDFAAHDYLLRGVRVLGVGSAYVVAYYDSQHQSGLTQAQRDLVRAWVRRHVAPDDVSPDAAHDGASVRTSDRHLRAAAAANARDPANHHRAREQKLWLVIGLLPAMLALAFVGYGVAIDGTAARGGAILVSAASILALVSAVVTWRHSRA